MPKLCTVEGCDKPHASRGYCPMHLARWKNHGTLDDPRPRGDQKANPLWTRWAQLKGRGVLAAEWLDFWRFADEVGVKPEGVKKMRRLDASKPYGPSNWEWIRTPSAAEVLDYAKRYRETNTSALKDKHFQRKYGITLAEYDAMLAAQDGCCAICRKAESRFVKKNIERRRMLCIDHDHATGEVRGLLCADCNVALGAFDDDPLRILKAIGYLRQHEREVRETKKKRFKVVE